MLTNRLLEGEIIHITERSQNPFQLHLLKCLFIDYFVLNRGETELSSSMILLIQNQSETKIKQI